MFLPFKKSKKEPTNIANEISKTSEKYKNKE